VRCLRPNFPHLEYFGELVFSLADFIPSRSAVGIALLSPVTNGEV
jgi:hypothetical protein